MFFQLVACLFARQSSARQFAKQLGWQEVLVRLFILQPRTDIQKRISWNTDHTGVPTQVPEIQMDNSGSATDPEMTNANLIDIDLPTPDESHPSMDILNSDVNANHDDDEAMKNSRKFWEELIPDALIDFQDGADRMVRETTPSSTTSIEDLSLRASSSHGTLQSLTGDGQEEMLTTAVNLEVAPTDSDVLLAIRRMGLRMPQTEDLEKTEELCQNLLIVLFTVAWKGVELSNHEAWKVRIIGIFHIEFVCHCWWIKHNTFS